MKTRLALSLVTLAGVGVLVGAATREARSQGASEPAFCAEMTPTRLLQDPDVARELEGAEHRGDPAAQARFHAMVAEMRAVHGCGALDGTDVGARDASPGPDLPPGHPPIQRQPRPPRTPMFGDDARVISI
jgi:hypothetical protein